MTSCPVCYALVDDDNIGDHIDWHNLPVLDAADAWERIEQATQAPGELR